MDVIYDDINANLSLSSNPAPERFDVSTNVCYGERFSKDEECVSKVENAGKR